MLEKSSWHDHAWRDPYIVFHENVYYIFITARAKRGLPDERGVIALAKSTNLF